jgi:hypothetical protein
MAKIGSFDFRDVEIIQGNWITAIYQNGEKRPYSYALFNEEVLSDEGEPVLKLLYEKPKKFKPLWEDKDGRKHFDIDWLDDYQHYNDITGKIASDIIQAIKEEYEKEN